MAGKRGIWNEGVRIGGERMTRREGLLHLAGKVSMEVGARRLGVTKKALHQQCYRLKIKWMRGAKGERITRVQLGEELGVSRQKILEMERECVLPEPGRGKSMETGGRTVLLLTPEQADQIRLFHRVG
jgi:hypothetical protein